VKPDASRARVPLGHKQINMFGRPAFTPPEPVASGDLRLLRKPNQASDEGWIGVSVPLLLRPRRLLMKTLSRKWDQRYFELAEHISKWSKDPKAQVGAVLLDDRTWPIALGYNGFPSGIADKTERLLDQNLKREMVVHAEQNALLCAGARARNGILFVFGKPVCPSCAVVIIQAGIKRVVGTMPEPTKNPGSETHKRGLISLEMFKEAGVKFFPYPPHKRVRKHSVIK
jgi:dCMP deaminase